MRPKVIITGAGGGMGRACARIYGNAYDLVLVDLASPSFESFVEELRNDGCVVEAFAGDVTSEAILSQIGDTLDGRTPFKLIHTAGIGPSQGDRQTIMDINYFAVERLLQVIEPKLVAGSSAVLIASMAGYMLPPMPEIAKVLSDRHDEGRLEKLEPVIVEMGRDIGPAGDQAMAYVVSKFGVHRLVEWRAADWGAKGARINSISPGVIMTPMTRREMASSFNAKEHGDAAALGRLGAAMDIALAAQFLTSDAAAYVTGIDLRVDGGSLAVERTRAM